MYLSENHQHSLMEELLVLFIYEIPVHAYFDLVFSSIIYRFGFLHFIANLFDLVQPQNALNITY